MLTTGKKFKRQFFVTFSVPSYPTMDVDRPEDLVTRSVVKQVTEILERESAVQGMQQINLSSG